MVTALVALNIVALEILAVLISWQGSTTLAMLPAVGGLVAAILARRVE